MKLSIALIRNGQVWEKPDRLIGTTDEPLREQGRALLASRKDSGVYPDTSLVFSSGLARCVETARILYPATPVVVSKELRAYDYGDFEGKTCAELSENESWLKWSGAARAIACPGGEDPYAAASRSAAAFKKIADEMAGKGLEHVSVITHKLIIQLILNRYSVPRAAYSDWSAKPAGGYLLRYDTISATCKVTDKL